MKILSTDIANDRNIYGDNIATKIIGMMFSFVSYVIQHVIQPQPSAPNITVKLFCSNYRLGKLVPYG